MGYLKDKYTKEYYLGSIDKDSNKAYGVEGYESFKFGRIHTKYQKFLLTLKLKNKEVLDIGSGRGEVVAYCIRKGGKRVVGIDFSKDAIDIARETNIANPKCEFIQMEAKDMEFKDEFDIVILFDVIEHIPDYEMQVVYSRIYAALKDNGTLILDTPFYKSSEDNDDSDFTPATKGMHCNKQTKEKLCSDLIKNKFCKYSIYVWSKSHKFLLSVFLYVVFQRLYVFLVNIKHFIHWYAMPSLLLMPNRIMHPKATFNKAIKWIQQIAGVSHKR